MKNLKSLHLRGVNVNKLYVNDNKKFNDTKAYNEWISSHSSLQEIDIYHERDWSELILLPDNNNNPDIHLQVPPPRYLYDIDSFNLRILSFSYDQKNWPNIRLNCPNLIELHLSYEETRGAYDSYRFGIFSSCFITVIKEGCPSLKFIRFKNKHSFRNINSDSFVMNIVRDNIGNLSSSNLKNLKRICNCITCMSEKQNGGEYNYNYLYFD
jgi:hypothetical protein